MESIKRGRPPISDKQPKKKSPKRIQVSEEIFIYLAFVGNGYPSVGLQMVVEFAKGKGFHYGEE